MAMVLLASGGCNSPLTPVQPDLGGDGPPPIVDHNPGHDLPDAAAAPDADAATDVPDAPAPDDGPVGIDPPVDEVVAPDSPDGPAADADASTDLPPTCVATSFVRCDGATLVTCNTSGDGTVSTDCGTPGCNATAQRCNVCVPSSAVCSQSTLTTCGTDGLVASMQACDYGCPPVATNRCADIAPANGLSSVLDSINASTPTLTINAGGTHTLDTDAQTLDGVALPTATVKTQGAGNPELLALAYRSISIPLGQTVNVTGSRALALVSSGDITIGGSIVLSAIGIDGNGRGGFTDGPGAVGAGGGGHCVLASNLGIGSGGGGGSNGYVGGAGGQGAKGNATTCAVGGGSPAARTDTSTIEPLIGGQTGGQGGSGNSTACSGFNPGVGGVGGGGGGALQLVTRGVLHLSGARLLAVGGGGAVGFTRTTSGVTYETGGGGGGSGGSMLFEAKTIDLGTATLANISATGGGGGAGTASTCAAGGYGGGGGGGGAGLIVMNQAQNAIAPNGQKVNPAAYLGYVTTR
jgi:hypothetical protein